MSPNIIQKKALIRLQDNKNSSYDSNKYDSLEINL